MCNKRNSSWIKIGKRRFRVDGCIRDLIRSLNEHGIQTLASCCGHGKYPVTIVYRHKSDDALNGNIYDFCSGWGIPRKRSFYKQDKKGYFYIPEVSKSQ